MSEGCPQPDQFDEARLATLKRTVADSRSLFDTFLLHSDHLLRFTDDLLRRADEITLPSAPVISVTQNSETATKVAQAPQAPKPRRRNSAPRAPIAHAPAVKPNKPLVVDLTDPAPSLAPPAPSALSGRAAPIVVVIGPVDRMGEIEDLTIDLETLPEIDVHFRLFRAGAYRIDASCSDLDGLTDRLRARKDVLAVDRQGPMVHVLPAPVTL